MSTPTPASIPTPTPKPKIYSFIHTSTTTVQGRDDNYTMSERHLVIENGTRSEYTKESKFTNGTASVIAEKGDVSIINKVSAASDKFVIKS